MSTTGKTHQIDVDYLFTNLKPKGFFQIAQFTVLALNFIVYGASLLKIIFIGILPEVKCAELNETQLADYGYEDNSSFVIKYEKCHIEIQNLNRSTNQTLPCVNGYSYVPERSRSFVSEFDLVCDKEGFSELTQTLYSVGGLIASLTVPVITDKYGRKRVYIILCLFLFGTELGLAFAQDYWTFAALRLVEGIMNMGMIGPAFTSMLELLPAKERTVLAASIGVIWGVSVVALAPLTYLLHTFSWRINALAFAAFAGIVFFEIWYIEESIRWLLTNGKIERCKRIIRRVAKENGVKFDNVWHKCIELSTALLPVGKDGYIEEEKEKEVIIPKVSNVGLRTLITDGLARKITIVVLINGLINSLTYNMIYMTAAQLSGNYYLNYFLTSSMEIVGNIMMFIMLMKFERRKTVVCFQCLSGSALILGVIINVVLKANNVAAIAKVVLSLIGMLGISASYCLLWLYVPEIYPTNLRNVGFGMLGISEGIGNMISPFSRVVRFLVTISRNQMRASLLKSLPFATVLWSQFFPWIYNPSNLWARAFGTLCFNDYDLYHQVPQFLQLSGKVLYVPWLPSTVFGAGSILCSLLLLTLPESRGQQMPTTMDDIRAWKGTRRLEKLALKNGDATVP